MNTQMLRRLGMVLGLGLLSVVAALGQAPRTTTWQGVQSEIAARQKIDVVTIADPTQRQTCRVHSIDAVEIVCAQHGQKTIFRAGDVAALIKPGVHTNYYFDFLAAGVGSIAAAGLFVFVCPACAVVAVVAAVGFFVAAPVSVMLRHGRSGDTLLYLAPGQRLQVRLN